MYYVYNDSHSKLTDEYTIPGNIQYIPNKNLKPDFLVNRTREQIGFARRTPAHDIKSSHYYRDVSSVRTPKELYRALKTLGASPTEAEAKVMFANFQDNLGGFDFRKFGDLLVCSDSDRRKNRRLDRVLVPDTRNTTVYAVRALPPEPHQTPDQKFSTYAATTRKRSLATTLDAEHPMSGKEKNALYGGEVDSKMTFPHSYPEARTAMHEYRQLYPRFHKSDLKLTTHADPLNTRALDSGMPSFHVASRPRPKTTITGTRVTRAGGLQQRPLTCEPKPTEKHSPKPFSRSANFRTIDLGGKKAAHPAAVSRGMWSHSPEPSHELRQSGRMLKHHPTSHKLAQLHHLAYRPMIRAAPIAH
jgi:hypothetical protein